LLTRFSGVTFVIDSSPASDVEIGAQSLIRCTEEVTRCFVPTRIAGQDIMLPIQSARIRTLGSFGFLYGRVEVRARMPRGDWIWPAIWMKPVDNEYGAWPSSGEIDLVEIRSNRKLRSSQGLSQGVDRMGATLHFGVNSSYNIWRPTHWEK
ncbi:unnamed protein product, partial [Timema podura]|nr:unnamed protein product [Timema podura]